MANEMSVAGTLVASTAQSVSLTANYPAFLVINQGTAPIYVTTDGTVASATSSTADEVPPNSSLTVPNRQGEFNLSVLSLFSTAAQTFEVLGVIPAGDQE